MIEKYYSTREAAALLGCGIRRVQSLIANGQLKSFPFGGNRHSILESDLTAFQAQPKKKPGPQSTDKSKRFPGGQIRPDKSLVVSAKTGKLIEKRGKIK